MLFFEYGFLPSFFIPGLGLAVVELLETASGELRRSLGKKTWLKTLSLKQNKLGKTKTKDRT